MSDFEDDDGIEQPDPPDIPTDSDELQDPGELGIIPSVDWPYGIPPSCAAIEERGDGDTWGLSTGCEFRPTTLKVRTTTWGYNNNCAFVASNVQSDTPANVTLHKSDSNVWKKVRTREIGPLRTYVFDVSCRHIEQPDTPSLIKMGSYKVVSDVPITLYQLNGAQGGTAALSDGTAVLPVSSLSTTYEIVGWSSSSLVLHEGDTRETLFPLLSYFAVVAVENDTVVTIVPSEPPVATTHVPDSGERFSVTMNDGDLLYVHADPDGGNLFGTSVQSSPSKPILVFTGSQLSMVNTTTKWGDHLEEVLPPTSQWGTEFIAAQNPIRRPDLNTGDPTIWQIYVLEDNTKIEFNGGSGGNGLPFDSKVFHKGDLVEFQTGGQIPSPGDFHVRSVDSIGAQQPKPIALLQYMMGSQASGKDSSGEFSKLGDPSVAYISPTNRYLSRYLIHLHENWSAQYVNLTVRQGATILLDDLPLGDNFFEDVPGTDYQVGRVLLSEGRHLLESENESVGFGAVVVSWATNSSVAYNAGMGLR